MIAYLKIIIPFLLKNDLSEIILEMIIFYATFLLYFELIFIYVSRNRRIIVPLNPAALICVFQTGFAGNIAEIHQLLGANVYNGKSVYPERRKGAGGTGN